MGPSASGKSVLLQTLAGRIDNMLRSGDIFMDGQEVDPLNVSNPIAYVPQFDSVIGDLTAREVTTQTALFKKNRPRSVIDEEVNTLLDQLGLSHVADGIIGTILFVSKYSPLIML
jgi:ABC-type multidrug transport system ATPase subunit